ncbi:hypothetical protein MPDQ_000632 [Monascus purpureus]|uniref:Uncharacterized protein n=1 Tax=Monascus purpureus TaxID=5098 RepID=A0A507QPJ9_MONPU|nr:hypothetical protein MPDQ_000632 [Monascus purpureus]BDD55143.1 hypothetical protein MAP00_000691 [Monascus purpureus]
MNSDSEHGSSSETSSYEVVGTESSADPGSGYGPVLVASTPSVNGNGSSSDNEATRDAGQADDRQATNERINDWRDDLNPEDSLESMNGPSLALEEESHRESDESIRIDTTLSVTQRLPFPPSPESPDNPASPALSAASTDSDSSGEEFYDCQETLPIDEDEYFNDGDEVGSNNDQPPSFAPANPLFLGKKDHDRARDHVHKLVTAKMMPPNGPHGPMREPHRTDPETASILSSFDEVKAKHIITMNLLNVLVCILSQRYGRAEKEAKKALEIARELRQEPTMARCFFWLGVIEYSHGNDERAYLYFLDAHSCVDEYPTEGKLLDMYLNLLQKGIRKEDRRKLFFPGNNSTAVNALGRSYFSIFTNAHLKRKWSALPRGESVLRMTAQGRSKKKSCFGKDSEKKKDTSTTVRPTVWIKRDAQDIQPRSAGAVNDGNLSNRHSALGTLVEGADLCWLNKYPYINEYSIQGPFAFKENPRGLAPRTRGTEIFFEQPWEIILSKEKWKSIEKTVGSKEVTMSFLKEEHEKLGIWSMLKTRAEQSKVKDLDDGSKPANISEHEDSTVESTMTPEDDDSPRSDGTPEVKNSPIHDDDDDDDNGEEGQDAPQESPRPADHEDDLDVHPDE